MQLSFVNTNPPMSSKELLATRAFWTEQLNIAKEFRLRNMISDLALEILVSATKPENIGREQGQIDSGVLGRLDLYYLAYGCNLSMEECRLISGLTRVELADPQEFDDSLYFADASAKMEIRFKFKTLMDMPDADLEALIARNEALYKAKPNYN